MQGRYESNPTLANESRARCAECGGILEVTNFNGQRLVGCSNCKSTSFESGTIDATSETLKTAGIDLPPGAIVDRVDLAVAYPQDIEVEVDTSAEEAQIRATMGQLQGLLENAYPSTIAKLMEEGHIDPPAPTFPLAKCQGCSKLLGLLNFDGVSVFWCDECKEQMRIERMRQEWNKSRHVEKESSMDGVLLKISVLESAIEEHDAQLGRMNDLVLEIAAQLTKAYEYIDEVKRLQECVEEMEDEGSPVAMMVLDLHKFIYGLKQPQQETEASLDKFMEDRVR